MATTIQSSLQLDETPKNVWIQYFCYYNKEFVKRTERFTKPWLKLFKWAFQHSRGFWKKPNWFIFVTGVKVNKSYSIELCGHWVNCLCSVFGITVANQGECVCTVTSRSEWLPPLYTVKIWKSVILLWEG